MSYMCLLSHLSHIISFIQPLNMSVLEKVHKLQAQMGSELQILTAQDDELFQKYVKRWTDIDRKTPAAIVLPISEDQIQETVCCCYVLERAEL
jgi:hypothetical protein